MSEAGFLGPTFAPSVGHLVMASFERFAHRVLLRTGGQTVTYGEAWPRVASLAGWLQTHSEPGARVAILLPNCQQYVELIVATSLAGRCRVPLNGREPVANQVPKLVDSDVEVVVTDAPTAAALAEALPGRSVRYLVVGQDLLPGSDGTPYDAALAHAPLTAADVPRRGGRELFRLAYTGGTTGEPKAVMTSHSAELAMARNLLMSRVVEPGQDRVFVAATPLSHASGSFVLPTLLAGGSIGWLDSFDPSALLDGGRWGTDVAIETFLVPTALADVVAANVDLPTTVHSIAYGGAPCPPDVQRAAARRFPKALSQLYGQAEVPMTICLLDRDDHDDLDRVDGAVGRPFPFVDVRMDVAVDGNGVGEILVRAEHAMLGYWNKPDASAAAFSSDGEVRTSDVGRLDAAGYVHIVDRARDLVISGGYNVYPADVERRLAGIAGVSSCAVVGVPHPRWGEAVVLVVVIADGADPDTVLSDVSRCAHERLASFERPKAVVPVAAIPLTALGKIDRKELQANVGDVFGSDGSTAAAVAAGAAEGTVRA